MMMTIYVFDDNDDDDDDDDKESNGMALWQVWRLGDQGIRGYRDLVMGDWGIFRKVLCNQVS